MIPLIIFKCLASSEKDMGGISPNVTDIRGFCNTTITGHISPVWGPDIDGEGCVIQYLVTVPFSFGYKFVAWQAASISSAVRLRCAVQVAKQPGVDSREEVSGRGRL